MSTLRADVLPHRYGHFGIVERDEKGRIRKGFPVPVKSAEPGCAQHIHVTLADKRRWCYDDGDMVEVVRTT